MEQARPTRSAYLAWAKRRKPARWNLSRSGAPVLSLDRLGLSLAELTKNESAEDGWPPLLARIASRHDVTPAHVSLAHACSMANHLAMAALVRAGDDVLLEHPTYEPLTCVVEYLGARAVALPRRAENAWHLNPDDVKAALTPRTTLVVVSNLHNPTGAFDDDETLTTIAAHAAHVGAHLLVDEVYLEFLHPQGVRTAARLAPNVITTNSVTKVYGLDALRMGWVIAEPALTERVRRLNDLFSNNVAHPSERLAERALSMADTFLSETTALLNRNLNVIDAFVAGEELLSWSRPRTGTIGLVQVACEDVDGFVEKLHAEHGVAVVPGSFFAAPDAFRIGCSLPTADLEAALAEMSRALRSVRR